MGSGAYAAVLQVARQVRQALQGPKQEEAAEMREGQELEQQKSEGDPERVLVFSGTASPRASLGAGVACLQPPEQGPCPGLCSRAVCRLNTP